jgi:hypothetical protein
MSLPVMVDGSTVECGSMIGPSVGDSPMAVTGLEVDDAMGMDVDVGAGVFGTDEEANPGNVQPDSRHTTGNKKSRLRQQFILPPR